LIRYSLSKRISVLSIKLLYDGSVQVKSINKVY